MDDNHPRVSGSDCGGLGLVPTIDRPTKKEMQARAGKFLLEIRLAPVVLDLRVREPISRPRANLKPWLALGDRGAVPISNPELRHQMKPVRTEPPRCEDTRYYACGHEAAEPCGESTSRDGPGEQGERAIGVPKQPMPDRPALRLIGIEQCIDRLSLDDERQLPGEVPGVLNARIHSLSADRTVNVRRVAREESAAGTVVLGLAMMQPEVTEPRRIAEDESSPRRIIHDFLELLQRKLVRVGGDFCIRRSCPLVTSSEPSAAPTAGAAMTRHVVGRPSGKNTATPRRRANE